MVSIQSSEDWKYLIAVRSDPEAGEIRRISRFRHANGRFFFGKEKGTKTVPLGTGKACHITPVLPTSGYTYAEIPDIKKVYLMQTGRSRVYEYWLPVTIRRSMENRRRILMDGQEDNNEFRAQLNEK